MLIADFTLSWAAKLHEPIAINSQSGYIVSYSQPTTDIRKPFGSQNQQMFDFDTTTIDYKTNHDMHSNTASGIEREYGGNSQYITRNGLLYVSVFGGTNHPETNFRGFISNKSTISYTNRDNFPQNFSGPLAIGRDHDQFPGRYMYGDQMIVKVLTFGAHTINNLCFEGLHNLVSVPVSFNYNWNNVGLENVFKDCTLFNSSNISNWNINPITTLYQAFMSARNFNKPLNWDTSTVTNMNSVFRGAVSFNDSSITGWDVSNCQSFHRMFYGATNFNQDLGTHWNFSGINTNTAFDDFLTDTNISNDNYNNLLNNFANNTNCLNKACRLTFVNNKPTTLTAQLSKYKLLQNSWTITDKEDIDD
jgi:hypothetical protein